MKMFKENLMRGIVMMVLFTVICGIVYTGAVSIAAQVLFHDKANGSMIEIDGKNYSLLLGQQFSDESYMWGRVMNLDVSTYKDADGNALMYGVPSNLSPASEEYEKMIRERVEKLKAADPMNETAVPVDLVTASGSGLDPDISKAAADYQVSRIADVRGISVEEVKNIIEKCTTHRFLGIFGEETVNVLKVNLMLDGLLE